MKPEFSEDYVNSPVRSCPPAEDQRAMEEGSHWIEIQLLGEDDQPVPWEEYSIVLPSGRELRGVLDDQGKARFDALTETGTAKISYPNLDQDAWDLIGPAEPPSS